MYYPIKDLEGIGPAYGDKLAQVGIRTTQGFLDHCASRGGRKRIAEATGISEKLLLSWANLADLMRIKGIGPQFSELLEAAGVDTIKELRTRNATNLAKKMAETQQAGRISGSAPSESQVAEWIQAAGSTDPIITH